MEWLLYGFILLHYPFNCMETHRSQTMRTFQEQIRTVRVHFRRLMDSWDRMTQPQRDECLEELRFSIDELDRLQYLHECDGDPVGVLYFMFLGFMLNIIALNYKTILGWVFT